MGENNELDKLLKILNQAMSKDVQSIDDFLKERMSRKERAMWTAIKVILMDVQALCNWNFRLTQLIDKFSEQTISILGKIPQLEGELQNLKKQRIEIALEAREDIIQTINLIQKKFEEAKKATEQYIA